ncbi:hypothetical protein [Ralstonia phage RSP15]|uniref:hypothetical protein n=1 Tax=Ralstonia phage RSP15 TaxID=1785960 RepID=UPI00074D4C11|nr:hypothetical protein BH754_gp162 [Ralstonia phage RSP15]BAU40144.1 hypothetical protein [Ralstonia phage RSP15]
MLINRDDVFNAIRTLDKNSLGPVRLMEAGSNYVSAVLTQEQITCLKQNNFQLRKVNV